MKRTIATAALLIIGTLEAQEATIRTGTQEVLLDLIVRDKKGKPVRDLKPEEIKITDEGLNQSITGFRLIDPQSAADAPKIDAPGSAVVNQLDPNKQVRLVTLVFDRLGVDGRRLSKSAAHDLVNTSSEPNTFFSVFTIDHRLSVLQQFTADKNLLKKAIDQATSGNYASFNSLSAEIQKQLETVVQAETSMAGASSNASSGGSSNIGSSAAQAKMAEMTLNMLRFSESAAREQQGRASIFSLLGLVKEQYPLPGRKTVMYFSEGLVVPSGLKEQFDMVVGSANRANVSVYAIDARGLLIARQNSEAVDMLAGAADSSKRQQLAVASGQQAAVTSDQAKLFDTAADSLRANRQNTLAELAEGTGGFVVANTNDLRTPLRQVSEDIRTYYAVSYSPKIEEFDGRFRKINVQVTRPDVKIQARSGYFALPMIPGQSLMPYEVPLLKALSEASLPKALPYRAAALRFDPRDAVTNCAFAIEVPIENVAFEEDKETKIYHGHVSAMVLVKNAQGAVVKKLSRDVPFRVPPDRLAQVRAGNFITTFHAELPPGRYTVESAVVDRTKLVASAKRSVLIVPARSPGVGMSSVSLVRRLDKELENADPGDPFHFSGGKVTPTLGDTIPAGKGASLSMYFVIYPHQSIADKPKLAIQFLKDGQVVGQAQPDLPAADATGRIPYIATSSAESMPAGQYEIRAVVTQGNTRAEEHSFFTVQ